MEKDKQKYANDNSYPLVRIADALEEVLRLVKQDQEDAKKRMLAAADEGLKEYNE
jgi:hypothetical protein